MLSLKLTRSPSLYCQAFFQGLPSPSCNGPQNQLIRAHRGSQRLNLQSAACMGLTSVLCIDVVFVRLGVLVGLLEVGAGVSLVYTPTFGTLSSCCTASSCLDVREMPSLVVT